MKRLLSLLMVITVFAASANPSWKMHTTFDEEVTRIVDTGKFTYFTSRCQPYTPGSEYNSTEYLSLFRYDKENDELLNLSTDNLLATNNVSKIEYSPEKGMLVVVHINQDVDLLYDDGKSENISAYRFANTGHDKTVNSIYIDDANNLIYLSTAFGYVALNEAKKEVSESRIYGLPVTSVARLGAKFLMIQGNRLLSADVSSPRFSVSDYETVAELDSPSALIPLGENVCLVMAGGGSPSSLYKVTLEDGNCRLSHIFNGRFYNAEHNSLGVTLPSTVRLYQFHPDGSYTFKQLPEGDSSESIGSYDFTEIWQGAKRKGFWSKKALENGEGWTLTRDCMLPDSPAPYIVSDMVWHPERGLLVANHGYDPNFPSSFTGGPLLVSAYKNGFWSNLSPIYTNPGVIEPLSNPNGLAVDPDNQDLLYFGSLMCGLERINMSDGTDVIHLSRRDDPYKNLPGFVEIVEGMSGGPSPMPGITNTWKESCPFAAPRFDYYGNLWTAFADFENQIPFRLHLFCWEAADRKATTEAENIRLPKKVEVEGYMPGNREIVVPLLTSKHRNLLAYTQRSWTGQIVIIDTNGTPVDTSDDKTYSLDSFIDQDGSSFDVNNIRFLWEDPATGYIWVGHEAGVFHFNPDNVISGNVRVTRIKVARNDGTNLADYLLDGVPVNRVVTDGNGRKWFATSGAGVICTSSDGRTVEDAFTTSNSPLPDDLVYGLGYIPVSNSMMMGTASGLAEYFMGGDSSGNDSESVKVYPNPVRPEYSGYVNIEGLAENSLVKIVDASGNLVKELGVVADGKGQWDVTNLAFKRVSSGVYFVLSSSADTNGTFANVGKVLVIN